MANLNKKKQSNKKTKITEKFNVIYEDEGNILPEIDDMDLLNFGLAFMKIRARELNNSDTKDVKTDRG